MDQQAATAKINQPDLGDAGQGIARELDVAIMGGLQVGDLGVAALWGWAGGNP